VDTILHAASAKLKMGSPDAYGTTPASPVGSSWPRDSGCTLSLTRAQLDALVLGLPWQRLGVAGVISVL